MRSLKGFVLAILFAVTSLTWGVESKIASSMEHTVFVDNGNVYGMGKNHLKQAHPKAVTTTNIYAPVYLDLQDVKSVAATGNRSVALTNKGKMFLWGGLIGTESTTPYEPFIFTSAITDVALTTKHLYFIVDGWLYSWAFTGNAIPLSPINDIKAVAAGDGHILALHVDGTVSTEGTNAYGQLGHGTKSTTYTGLTKVQNVRDVVEIAAGSGSSLVRTSTGTIYGWGRNHQNQFGLADRQDKVYPTWLPLVNVKKMTVNYAASFFLMNDGSIQSAGWHNYIANGVYNTNATFTVLPALSGVKQLHAGGQGVYVDFGASGQLRGWGGNGVGQLGDTTNIERHAPTYAYFTSLPAYVEPVTQVAVVAPATGTCGSIYSNPFSNAQASNKNGAACKDQANHNGRKG